MTLKIHMEGWTLQHLEISVVSPIFGYRLKVLRFSVNEVDLMGGGPTHELGGPTHEWVAHARGSTHQGVQMGVQCTQTHCQSGKPIFKGGYQNPLHRMHSVAENQRLKVSAVPWRFFLVIKILQPRGACKEPEKSLRRAILDSFGTLFGLSGLWETLCFGRFGPGVPVWGGPTRFP